MNDELEIQFRKVTLQPGIGNWLLVSSEWSIS